MTLWKSELVDGLSKAASQTKNETNTLAGFQCHKKSEIPGTERIKSTSFRRTGLQGRPSLCRAFTLLQPQIPTEISKRFERRSNPTAHKCLPNTL